MVCHGDFSWSWRATAANQSRIRDGAGSERGVVPSTLGRFATDPRRSRIELLRSIHLHKGNRPTTAAIATLDQTLRDTEQRVLSTEAA